MADQLREAVAVFGTKEPLQAAIDDLLTSGFNRHALSLLGADGLEATLDHEGALSTKDLTDSPDAPREQYVAPESHGAAQGGLIGGMAYVSAVAAAGLVAATGGALALAIGAATLAGGGGGAVGAVLARAVGKAHKDRFTEQLESGGVILWVRTPDADAEREATRILKVHGGVDVHVHAISAD
jgi:hypothetical protein